ncbi:hypothetical protein BC826DRAFT_299172 [Russula brevipes]|nr:hypothetical protein BC826DRAFT_299172 [Russula brevipes]
MQDISALCNLCLANARIGDDDDTALSMAEEAIELTLTSSDGSSQPVLIGALLNKSKILSSRGQSEAALSFSDQAVTLLRKISSARPVFSLFLAHALDIHSHNLSDANRKGDAYSIVQEAVMLWQTLKASAPGPIARPLAGALFQLAKFRHRDDKRNALREELRIAKSAVDVFREIIPPDAPGLADALYLYADRMLELDKTREAAACAEESIQHFRQAVSEDRKYSLDLIFSLSLASSCLARTERADDAFEYAKQAVEVQHGRKGAKDAQFEAHLRKLLMDVVVRATDVGKEAEAVPWVQELQALTVSEDKYANSLARRSGKPQGKSEEFKKETSYWIDENTNAPRSNSGPTTSAAVTSRSTPGIDKGKGKEVAHSPGWGVLPYVLTGAKQRS